MASAELSRRVEKLVAYPPLCDMDADQRREFQEALRHCRRGTTNRQTLDTTFA
jgi:hypothetical protein